MNTPVLSNVRLILDSYSRLSRAARNLGIPIGVASSYKDGYSTCYSITEEQYQIADNHKIGVVGIKDLGVPDQSFYQSDLRTLIQESLNKHAGFYEIVESDSFAVGDIISIDIFDLAVKQFDVPLLIVGEDANNFYIKFIIETFEKPIKKSFKDIIMRNPYWDCGKVSKKDLTHKYQKLSIQDVMPSRSYVDIA